MVRVPLHFHDMAKIPQALVGLFLFCFVSISHAEKLTPEQAASLLEQVKSLKENLDNHLRERNTNAGSKFMSAASDPKAAVSLWLQCNKLVVFDRENRSESDFRAWEDSVSDQIRDPRFVESLQLQLRYLGLSCQAAEAESIVDLFSPLMSYVDSLSRMEELPHDLLSRSVTDSIFAEAYHLGKLLGENPSWEFVPINIEGIYEQIILPYLRSAKPEALQNAWDKRIEQESRLVQMFEAKKEEAMRGQTKDQKRRMVTVQDRRGGLMGKFDAEEFSSRTLPRLRWGKLKDQFLYVDQLNGAKAMLEFVKQHLTHELGEEFFADFEETISMGLSASSEENAPVSSSN